MLLQLVRGDSRLLEVFEDIVEGSDPQVVHRAIVEVDDTLVAHLVPDVLFGGVQQRRCEVEVSHHLQEQGRVHVPDKAHELRVQARLGGRSECLEPLHQRVRGHHHLLPFVLVHDGLEHLQELAVQLVDGFPRFPLRLLDVNLILVDRLQREPLHRLPDRLPVALRNLLPVEILDAEDVQHLVLGGGDVGLQDADIDSFQG
mmetsp:Transcript_9343/g.16033  ORF Transcript_9343/g.16033 Transcript_9343/m.16033 type:complete len:201 (-) Transcript_9343:490-1092(-)